MDNSVYMNSSISISTLSGGDPTGTGRGGESIFGGKFEGTFYYLIHSKCLNKYILPL